jgi:hypothetical protein
MCRRVQVRVRRTPYIYLRAKNLKGTATLTRSLGWQTYAGRMGVTDSPCELIVVALVAIAVFFSVWHVVAPLIGYVHR